MMSAGGWSWAPSSERPPTWLVAATFTVLSLLLLYPLHAPYLYGDQDLPTVWALFELNRGGFSPFSLYYPSGLTNLLRGVYEVILAAGPLFGYELTPQEFLDLYIKYPHEFRMLPRLVAMLSGMVTLVAVWRTSRRLMNEWSALLATTLMGTSLMFVREHHVGMWDAPASACISIALAFSVAYVARPTVRTFAAACAATGFACAFRYNACFAAVAPATAWIAAAPAGVSRAKTLAIGAAAAVLAMLIAAPAVVLEPARVAESLQGITGVLSDVTKAKHVMETLPDLLTRGLGIPMWAIGALGAGIAVVRRDRRMLPLIVFVAGYGLVIHFAPIKLNRYALPLTAPIAVLAVYALDRWLPFSPRALVTLAIVAVSLMSVWQHLRLLATEDSRVAAARWIQANVDDDTPVFMAGRALSLSYLRPDEAWRPMQPTRSGPQPGPAWRPVQPSRWRPLPGAAKRSRLPHGLVVTSQAPLDDMISEDLVLFLEQRTEIVADFPIEKLPGDRDYESPYSLPFTGLGTLLRPGPRITIWKIRPPMPANG